jgi:pimeloyl-ACP methyl ester carboxylesterase
MRRVKNRAFYFRPTQIDSPEMVCGGWHGDAALWTAAAGADKPGGNPVSRNRVSATNWRTMSERVNITARGRDLALEYVWVGEKFPAAPVMVFLHEGLGSVAAWRDFPEQLCARLKIRGLVYSRYAYGQSTPRPHAEKFPFDYLRREAVEVLTALLAKLGVTRPWLFGHSDGGTIALLAAAHLPGDFAGIVVMAPHIFVERVAVENIAKARAAYEQGPLRKLLARYHADVDSAFYAWCDAWLNPAFAHLNIEKEIEPIACPVLAIQGDADEYATLEQIKGIQRRVPHTQLLVVPSCKHSPHRDQPAAIMSAVAAFIATNSDGAPLRR